MKKIRAKFRVTGITGEEGHETVTLKPVYSADPNSENYDYSKYTPSGSIEMTITNPDAFGFFDLRREVLIEFTHAEETQT
jgi:hypothetical protein